MEILIPLILMLIVSFVPKLLSKYLTREIKYPDLPEQVLVHETEVAPKKVTYQPKYKSEILHASPAISHRQSTPVVQEEQSAWQGKIDNNMILNGVIFAEILQPPRAYRPLMRRSK